MKQFSATRAKITLCTAVVAAVYAHSLYKNTYSQYTGRRKKSSIEGAAEPELPTHNRKNGRFVLRTRTTGTKSNLWLLHYSSAASCHVYLAPDLVISIQPEPRSRLGLLLQAPGTFKHAAFKTTAVTRVKRSANHISACLKPKQTRATSLRGEDLTSIPSHSPYANNGSVFHKHRK